MSTDPARDWVLERAHKLGFDLCGIARAEQLPELERFREWLDRGYAGEMKYLHDPRRLDPRRVMTDLRSVIVCALNYNTAHPHSTEMAGTTQSPDSPAQGWISRYAWGTDYHEVMWHKLRELIATLQEKFPEPFAARAYADTGPVSERLFAKHAGLGWLGKNTLLLNEKYGSWLFLGVIFTSLDLAPTLGPADVPPPDLCGNCRQCLDACPTKALVEPYVLDARRCISYLTIELRGSIPPEFREPMGRQVYGCDICQDVCPYNRKVPNSAIPDFEPRQKGTDQSLFQPVLEWLAQMDQEQFRETFGHSAIKRAKWAGLLRNVCLALGNIALGQGRDRRARTAALLKNLSQSANSTVAESANWALRRIQ